VRRREFITLLRGAAAWPVGVRAQQAKPPTIGFMGESTAEGQRRWVAAFVQRLGERGWIVFNVSDDPVKLGLVASVSRPGGNATGVNTFMSELVAKRLGLLGELLPAATRFGALVNPNAATTEDFIKDFATAAGTLGTQVEIAQARDSREIEAAFAALSRNKTDALTVAPDTFFASRNVQIVTLAARHAIPTVYTVRSYVEHGGLMSYGPSVPDAYRQLAIYAARILKGDKPADLPVVQVNKLDLVINMPTARALGLEVPATLLARADEVIE
jgi:putative ABC transport system substrate-binding protein